MTREEIDHLVRAWLDEEPVGDIYERLDTSFAVDHTPPGDDVDATAAAMFRGHHEALFFEWRDAVERHNWKKAEPRVNVFLAERNIKIAKDSDTYRLLCLGVTIASRQLHWIQTERSLGNWDAKPEYGSLLGPAAMASDPVAFADGGPATVGAPPLHTVVEQFLEEKRRIGRLKPKRLMDFEAALKLLCRRMGCREAADRDHQGGDRRASHPLTKLPSNFTKLFPATDLEQVVAIAAEKSLRLLDPTTVNQKYLAIFEAFFEWCVTCGIATDNPATGVRIKGASSSNEIERGTFTIDELKAIYNAPLFTGCLSDGRIDEPGEHRVTEHRYWLPLLGLFTGARPGEPCQLLVSDVREIEGVWCFDITAEGGRSLKTRAAHRQVPLHPEARTPRFPLARESL